jgi:hypothetical protein
VFILSQDSLFKFLQVETLYEVVYAQTKTISSTNTKEG